MRYRKKKTFFEKYITPVYTSRNFPVMYLLVSIGILVFTTILWSILGAIINLGNADSSVNPLLFESSSTFHGASLPEQHTFLFKQPLFLLIKFLGANDIAFIVSTVLIVLLTIGTLAYLISRIERRPVVLATIYLALALCLLLTPTEPYAGSLLPVNLAMLATRNIEYVVLIAGLLLVIRSGGIRTKQFIYSCLVFAALFASDRLFLGLSLGGAVAMSIVYLIGRKKPLLNLSLRWAFASILGYMISMGVIFVLQITHIITIGSSAGSSPYSFVSSLKDGTLAIIYGFLGIFTNFGANPVVDIRVAASIPSEFFHRMMSLNGVVFVITICITLLILVSMAIVFIRSLKSEKKKVIRYPNQAVSLSLLLFFTTLIAVVLFVSTNHYYPVDSRYLTIVLFAGFIAFPTYLRGVRLKRTRIILCGCVITLGIVLGSFIAVDNFNTSIITMNTVVTRNERIIQTINSHPGTTLIGDYWRVIPIKQKNQGLGIVPLEDCFTPRKALTSSTWQLDISHKSFTYLLSLDATSPAYPHCTLDQVVKEYGRPNSSSVIQGSLEHPQELLLFYDGGIHKNQPLAVTSPTPSTVVPKNLADVKKRVCNNQTIMNFSAHEDDDILFMNPDLLHDIKKGSCIRSVYFTAGDAGADNNYWTGRQKGTQAAYDSMLGKNDQVWIDQIIRLPSGQFATISNPSGNSAISLLFLHIPDGNMNGNGFASTRHESLGRLYSSHIPLIRTVDNSSTYTREQLINTLVSLMQFYTPESIRSQSADKSGQFIDHSDHTNVAYFTTDAYTIYTQAMEIKPQIVYYLGYPVHSLPGNVFDEDLIEKTKAFEAFGRYDNAVCHSSVECDTKSVYGFYLRRQYIRDH